MKTNLSFAKCALLTMMVVFSHEIEFAQSPTKSSQKTTGSDLVLSISGIEYDDSGFSLMKESLQKTKNVTAIKSGYDQGTAKITFTYPGSATQLWDELPKTTKQFFKITTIDDSRIVLETKNASKQATATTAKLTSTATNNDADCKNCYFNLCKYDGIKTFQGVVFRQINKDDGTYYYNCDNGVLVVKQVFVNGYGVTTKITSDTILMSNVPVGTKWNVSSSGSSFLGLSSKSYSDQTLFKKGISMQVNGTTYNDVIVVYTRQYSNDNILGESSSSAYLYYAKGVGLIKTENLGAIRDPTYASNQNTTAKNDNAASDELYKTMKGNIDQTITGTWKYHDQTMNWDLYYVFNSDGTYQYYVGSVNPENQMPEGTCYWKVDGNYLQLLGEGWNKVYAFELKKKNDPTTGKPTLVIQFKDTEYRIYFSEDRKTAW